MRSSINQRSTFGRSKLLGSAVLLAATSSLFACSEPDASVSSSAQTETTPAIESTQVSTAQTEMSAMIAAPENASESLKNVSATVYKDANCGCCKEWISHAEAHGMDATGQDVADLRVFKERYGVPNNMQSCHTAVTTDGYVFEGHIPAKYVAQFLENPPNGAIGLAVPGMPMGSPGMEYQNRFDPYQVMQINKDGSTSVYADIDTFEAQL